MVTWRETVSSVLYVLLASSHSAVSLPGLTSSYLIQNCQWPSSPDPSTLLFLYWSWSLVVPMLSKSHSASTMCYPSSHARSPGHCWATFTVPLTCCPPSLALFSRTGDPWRGRVLASLRMRQGLSLQKAIVAILALVEGFFTLRYDSMILVYVCVWFHFDCDLFKLFLFLMLIYLKV